MTIEIKIPSPIEYKKEDKKLKVIFREETDSFEECKPKEIERTKTFIRVAHYDEFGHIRVWKVPFE